MAGQSWVAHKASPKNFSRVFLETWDEANNLLISSRSFSRFKGSNMIKPDWMWNSQPIHTMVGPSSHFFQEMGSWRSMHKIAIVDALRPMILVSWNISESVGHQHKEMKHGVSNKICERVVGSNPPSVTKSEHWPQLQKDKLYSNIFDPWIGNKDNPDNEGERPFVYQHFSHQMILLTAFCWIVWGDRNVLRLWLSEGWIFQGSYFGDWLRRQCNQGPAWVASSRWSPDPIFQWQGRVGRNFELLPRYRWKEPPSLRLPLSVWVPWQWKVRLLQIANSCDERKAMVVQM